MRMPTAAYLPFWLPLDASLRNTRRMVGGDPRHQFIALPEPLAAVESQREGERAIRSSRTAASRYSSAVGSRYPPALRPTMALAHRTGWFLA